MTPAEIAAEALRIDRAQLPAKLESVGRLPGGLSNETWLVRLAGEAVVVRINNTNDAVMRIDRRSEARVLVEVAAAGIGAEVVVNCPERHFLVTRYRPGKLWTFEDARRPDNVGRMARLLRRLHALPLPSGVRRMDYAATVRGYWASLEDGARREAVGGDGGFERALQLAETLAGDAQVCLCHNDLYHLNVVDSADRALCLLDWEYAGLGDPYFDLAAVCCYHSYDEPLQRQLLREYAQDLADGGSGDRSHARLQAMGELFDYIGILWLEVRAAANRSS